VVSATSVGMLLLKSVLARVYKKGETSVPVFAWGLLISFPLLTQVFSTRSPLRVDKGAQMFYFLLK
jgi:hypothetical protein